MLHSHVENFENNNIHESHTQRKKDRTYYFIDRL